jgi:hypothetical protein
MDKIMDSQYKKLNFAKENKKEIYPHHIPNQMTNNDILRRIRFIFDFSDTKIKELFGKADYKVTRSQFSNCLKKEDDP